MNAASPSLGCGVHQFEFFLTTAPLTIYSRVLGNKQGRDRTAQERTRILKLKKGRVEKKGREREGREWEAKKKTDWVSMDAKQVR